MKCSWPIRCIILTFALVWIAGIPAVQVKGVTATLIPSATIVAYFPKVRLWDRNAVCVSVYPPYQLLNVWTNPYETWYVCQGTWAHLNGAVYKSLTSFSVFVRVSLLSLLGNGSVKIITAATNADAKIEELLNVMFFTRSVSYRRKVVDQFFPELLVIDLLFTGR
jgi:hypothetical protein